MLFIQLKFYFLSFSCLLQLHFLIKRKWQMLNPDKTEGTLLPQGKHLMEVYISYSEGIGASFPTWYINLARTRFIPYSKD